MSMRPHMLWIWTLMVFGLWGAITPAYADPDPNSPPVQLRSAGLINLQQWAAMALSEPPVPVEDLDKLDIKYRTGLFAHLLVAGQRRTVKKMIVRVMNKLTLDGDFKDYKVLLNASPVPNASINVKKREIHINLGLIAWVRSEDEFAGIIAHEMTHGNPEHLKAHRDSAEVDDLLNTVPGFKDLDSQQQEELRADLGALERMIAAGYNPWEFYRFFQRLAAANKGGKELALFNAIFKVIFRRSYNYMEAHPTDEIRMAAIKAYVAKKSFEQDLSKITSQRKTFSGAMGLLRLRAKIFAAPVNSKMLQRALMAYIAYGLVHDSGAIEALQHLGQTLATPDSAGAGAGAAQQTAASTQADQDAAVQAAKTLETIRRIATISGLAFGVGTTRLLFYDLPMHWDGAAYRFLKSTNRQSKVVAKYWQRRLKQGHTDIDTVTHTLGLSKINLANIGELYDTGGIHFYRRVNGLHATRKRATKFLTMLLKTTNEILDQATVNGQQLTTLQAALASLPGYIYEDRAIYRELQRVYRKVGPMAHGGEAELAGTAFQQRMHAAALREVAKRQLSVGEQIDLAEALFKFGMINSALKLLQKNYTAMVSFAFSHENTVPNRAHVLEELTAAGKQKGSLSRVGFRQRLAWDRRLVTLRAKFHPLKPMTEQLGPRSLAAAIPISTLPGGKLSWTVRHWLARGDRLAFRGFLAHKFNSVAELKAWVDSEALPRHVLLDNLSSDFQYVLAHHPKWLRTQVDFDALFAAEYFWPQFNGTYKVSALEKMFYESAKEYAKKFPKAWRFEPGAADALHQVIVRRLGETHLMPQTEAGKFALWLKLTDRGITTVTDQLFGQLYATRDPFRKAKLERLAVDEGRLWEPQLRAAITRTQLQRSPQYQQLIHSDDHTQRATLLQQVIADIQDKFPERGVSYMDLLEDLSNEINSSEQESALIAEAKQVKGGQRSQDLSLRVMSELIDTALTWKKRDQWRLILYLRGDAPPSRRIKREFARIGPERVRRSFSLMPVMARASLLDSYMSSPRGLLPKVNSGRGNAKRAIEHLLRNSDPATKEVATQVLEAFLYSLKKTGNEPLQSFVLSYLLAAPPGEHRRAGHVLKDVLEAFGTTGIKIGQFLVAAEIRTCSRVAI